MKEPEDHRGKELCVTSEVQHQGCVMSDVPLFLCGLPPFAPGLMGAFCAQT